MCELDDSNEKLSNAEQQLIFWIPKQHAMSEAKKLKLDENPNPDGCQQFVERKKRWCRMTVGKGNRFCGEHGKANEEVSRGE